MARDIKVNYNQLTRGQLRRMCDTLLSLADDQRVVVVPEPALEKAAGSRKVSPAVAVAMDVSGGSDDDGVAAQNETTGEKKGKGRGKKEKKKKKEKKDPSE